MASTMRFDKWENSLGVPYQAIIQVVSATYVGAEVSNSTTTYADTNLTATITPKFANSKLLITIHGNVLKNNTNTANSGNIRLLRNSTVVKTLTSLFVTNTALENGGSYSFAYIDSPNTTAAVTYKTQFANSVASSVIVHGRGHDGTITIMEIAQ